MTALLNPIRPRSIFFSAIHLLPSLPQLLDDGRRLRLEPVCEDDEADELEVPLHLLALQLLQLVDLDRQAPRRHGDHAGALRGVPGNKGRNKYAD